MNVNLSEPLEASHLIFDTMKRRIISICQWSIASLCLVALTVAAQTKVQNSSTDAPALNLDTTAVSKELSAEIPETKNTDKVSAAPDKFAKSLEKAAKYRGPPKVEEIYEQGSTDRVEKVTPIFGDEYCAYTPSQGRTDGIDSIKDGMQFQVRSCPDYF